jgi:hypothetical protein
MKRIALVTVALTAFLGGAPPAPAKAPSFALWWKGFSARVQRDITRIERACEGRFGRNDAKVGACFVKAERVSLRLEGEAMRKQIAIISRGQTASCKKAIHVYWLASRKAAKVNLIYLDSHPHVAVTRLSRDLNRKPYTTLKMHTFRAKSEAIRICG